MRTAAEVGEGTVGVERNRSVLQVAYKFALVLVALLGELRESVGFRHLRAHHRLLVAGQFDHLRLDFRKVRFENRRRRIDVVVESLLDSRTDTELDARVESLQSLGEQVRRRVPESVLALGIVPFEEFNRGILLDRTRQIDRRVVYRSRQGVRSETRADTLGNLISGCSLCELAHRAVGKRNLNHSVFNKS